MTYYREFSNRKEAKRAEPLKREAFTPLAFVRVSCVHKPLASLLIATCLLLTASCGAAPPLANPPWAYADLRRLDAAGDTASPATDLLAVYTRLTGYDLQIRLDLLDLTQADDAHYEIRLWDDANYAQTPLTIQIPSQGMIRLVQPPGVSSRMQARLVRDPALDTVTLSLNRYYIGERYAFEIYTYPATSSSPADKALDIRFDNPSPQAQAPLLLAFTDTFPATTPAQALRRWDGAHTGPTGERHGLRQVLDNARRFQVPVALLDLKTTPNLAALDFLGVTEKIRQMAQEGLLLLPDVAYGDPSDISLHFSRRAATGFGLPLSPFIYAAASRLVPGASAQFVSLPDTSHISRSASTRLIPIPVQGEDMQATLDGPSLAIRSALVNAALSSDPTDLVVVGGSLPASTWSQADRAAATFAWLAAHPWIHALDGNDLMTFPIGADDQPATPITTSSTNLALSTSFIDNAIGDSAWLTFFMLTAPNDDELLAELKGKYINQLSVLRDASEWAENPTSKTLCNSQHCLLSNERFFAFIATDGARLTHLFYLDDTGPHQLIAPSSQFAVGLSDPSTWQSGLDEAADPSVVPGAFFDDQGSWMPYTQVLSASIITLTSADNSRIKSFQLREDGLVVRYQVRGYVRTRIPLVVDPQAFFSGPSEYRAILAPGSWTWGQVDGIQLQVRTDASFSAQGFTVSRPFLSQSENPNIDYPPGHYYPFPLSIVDIRAYGDFNVEIIPLK